MNDYNSAKYVVYSTCSIYQEENEQVIKDILSKKQFRCWHTVPLNKVDIGIKGKYKNGFHYNEELGCMRICGGCGPKNYLNGFFLAIFERNQWIN